MKVIIAGGRDIPEPYEHVCSGKPVEVRVIVS
jgi:hypothetical protein